MTTTLLAIGICLMLYGMTLRTENFLSHVTFKVFPFLSGMFVTAYAAYEKGWVNFAA